MPAPQPTVLTAGGKYVSNIKQPDIDPEKVSVQTLEVGNLKGEFLNLSQLKEGLEAERDRDMDGPSM